MIRHIGALLGHHFSNDIVFARGSILFFSEPIGSVIPKLPDMLLPVVGADTRAV